MGVSIKITFEYFFMRKKHVENTQKSCFLGGNLKIFKIEFKVSIAFLKTFYMPFSNLKNSYYFQRYIQKTEKNSYIVKTDISRKLYDGSFSNFDNSQFIKFTNFCCSYFFFYLCQRYKRCKSVRVGSGGPC